VPTKARWNIINIFLIIELKKRKGKQIIELLRAGKQVSDSMATLWAFANLDNLEAWVLIVTHWGLRKMEDWN
jgi:hypothetical protein